MGNSKSELRKHYETAEKTGVLNVTKCNLTELSPELLHLGNNLRSMNLSNNKFTKLKNIDNFINLKTLYLDYNQLTELPSEIGELSKLEVLSAANNSISILPSTLSNLLNLKRVELSHNALKEFPIVLCNLKRLDLLDLSHNHIETVPSEIGLLHVTELNLDNNKINSMAEEIADCPRLKTLRIRENCMYLSGVPPKILAHSNISTINAEGNLFQMKDFMNLDGYDEYMERYTSVKKKLF